MLKFAIAIAGCLLAVSVSSAEEANDANIGDIMASQQERHLKLWFAGRAGNWPLADYEIGKLKDGFDDIDKLMGGDTVGKAVGAPICGARKSDREQGQGFIHARVRSTDGRLQQLPSHPRSRLHRHPTPNCIALQQSVFRTAEIGRPRQGAAVFVDHRGGAFGVNI